MTVTAHLWRLVEVKDERRSTWELVGSFPTARKARARISELAGRNIVSPDEEIFYYEDGDGRHDFRIEVEVT